MRLDNQRESSNVEDRRSSGGGFGGGGFRRAGMGGGGIPLRGGSLVTIAVLIGIGWLVFGINPLHMLSILTGGGGYTDSQSYQPSQPSGGTAASGQNDPGRQFVAKVLGSTEDVWSEIFASANKSYQPAPLVLFRGTTVSACGQASSASGPFYCPNDGKVYIDLAFYDELRSRFGAPGDFAQAYVIAHEVGHHVQDLIGVLPEFNRQRQTASRAEANEMSVRVELQADCFAGIWANKTDQKGMLEAGDIDEALNAATQIGDDTIQKRTQGHVVPDSFTHGTSAQRSAWFKRGYESGRMEACDTFSGSI
ncbi:zinc metallopeptidase [Kaistia geumhonensis]|uniref:Metalloprotease n=1 Tax=Kaistia geumhonensis TaxID=410839 RepID=A0ABU0MBL8_9HYPH|nr:neutral zinc metallopeptidase [Kaistia geumhonensis]MCX5481303.1 zinc metallopeptidase [Kaistia geumhonensis]MDQ0518364.1 putative metalloprotease [Kaistia geumhonensis]